MVKDLDNIAKRCYKIHIELADSRIIHNENNTNPLIDQNLINDSLNDLNNRLEIKLKAKGEVSSILLKQLLIHHRQVGEIYEIQVDSKSLFVKEFFQSGEILDLIESLEEGICLSERKPFNKEPLIELGHVHHGAYGTMGYSAIKNCINYWYFKGNLKENKKVELQELLVESEHNLSARMYSKAIQTLKTKGLTGEWLIYKKHKGINYYLCLAKHDEGDQIIYENKIQPCLLEFPELENNMEVE